jgi:hypothetical protein
MVQRPTGSLSPYSLVGALVLALLAGVSFFIFTKELDQYSRGVLGDTEGFQHWLDPQHEMPLSINGQVDLLSGCIFALESWKTRFRSNDDISLVAQNCATEAERIAGVNPNLSEAHYLLAYTSFLKGAQSDAIGYLAVAQKTAPTDQWLAVRRVRLAQSMLPGEVNIEHYNLQNDLGLLIASNRGLDTAASLYIKYPQLRDMIIASTEDLRDSDRARFLSRLKNAVARN